MNLQDQEDQIIDALDAGEESSPPPEEEKQPVDGIDSDVETDDLPSDEEMQEEDDGRSWSKGLMIDERVGCSYPDAQQSSDGTIYLTWDFNRSKDQEILMTTFREEDVLAISDAVTTRVKSNRRLVSKGGTPE